MPQKAINRRRYGSVIRFLTETVENEKASLRVRMMAAERLIELYAAHDKAEMRSEARGQKSPSTGTPATRQTQDGPATPQESAQDDNGPATRTAFDQVLEYARVMSAGA